MDDIKRKSLKEVLPKRGLAVKEKTLPPVKQAELADYYQARQGRGGLFFVWTVIIIILFVGGYYLSNYFTLVTIKIFPKQTTVAVDGRYQAEKTPSSTALLFSTVQAEDSAQIMIPATGSQKINAKASGQVVIYNNYSPTSQKLIASTRLETNGGKIFRLNQTIIVPGEKKTGKTTTPGSIEADITADQAGGDYNVGLADFHFSGFQGTAKYDQFVARAKTPVGGGVAREIKIAASTDQARARAILQKTLTDRLVKKTRLQIPKDFVLFKDAMILSFNDISASSSPDVVLERAYSLTEVTASSTITNQIAFTEQLKLTGVLFSRKNLANQLLTKTASGTDNNHDNLNINNVEDIQFTLLNKDSFDPDKTTKIAFTLNGQAQIVWAINAEELKAKLAGTSLKNKDKIFAGYPNVFKVETSLRPPWIINFPINQAKIIINIENIK